MADDDELLAAVRDGDAERVAALVGSDPALANARDADGLSALMLARYRSDRSTMDALLAADPDLDVYEAAAYGRLDRLREALDGDPDLIDAFAPDGFTALHLAAYFGKAEVARELLERGADHATYTRNDFANQPLHAAAAGRHVELCRLLLAAGADVNTTQHGGYTPLHEAAGSGDVALAELFLSAGASPTALTDDGQTPAQVAESAGHTDLAARLRD